MWTDIPDDDADIRQGDLLDLRDARLRFVHTNLTNGVDETNVTADFDNSLVLVLSHCCTNAHGRNNVRSITIAPVVQAQPSSSFKSYLHSVRHVDPFNLPKDDSGSNYQLKDYLLLPTDSGLLHAERSSVAWVANLLIPMSVSGNVDALLPLRVQRMTAEYRMYLRRKLQLLLSRVSEEDRDELIAMGLAT